MGQPSCPADNPAIFPLATLISHTASPIAKKQKRKEKQSEKINIISGSM
jgi:hypothetical protein